MALTNFTLPFGALAQSVQQWGATIAPLHSQAHHLATNTNNLLYSPADHQQQDDGPPADGDYYKNNPYAPPQMHQQPQPQHQQQPQQQQQQQQSYHYNNGNGRRKGGNTYLPPVTNRNTQQQQQHQQPQQQQQQYHHQQFSHFNKQQQQQQQQHITQNNVVYKSATSASVAQATATRTYGEGSYNRFPASSVSVSGASATATGQVQQKQYYNSFSATQTARTSSGGGGGYPNSGQQQQPQQQQGNRQQDNNIPNLPQQTYGPSVETPAATYGAAAQPQQPAPAAAAASASSGSSQSLYPDRPPGFTRVQAGQGSRTQVHAVLDYDGEDDEEDYYDEQDRGEPVAQDAGKKTSSSSMPTVTPIQGPIFLKNGTVPVVPLFSYPQYNNGTFVQIPIWWTALSVALGLDVRGDIIKGVPCIKRYHQLFCPTAGNSYPIEKIEKFIDDNKSLMRRMYGDFEMNMDDGGPRQQTKRKRRFIDEPDIFIPPGAFPATIPDDPHSEPHDEEAGESYFGKLRNKRQAQNRNSNRSGGGGGNGGSTAGNGPNFNQNGQGNTGPTGRLDACESKVEIVTPYWASNSAGKIRAIVNTQHFEQAIHQEICSKTQTPRCERDCGCEQKYKWHRLLAYDPDNDCKGIFMDWFLFPSCCVCRCNP